MKINFYNRKEEGFSLLELVVAVGILLVLTVGGLLAYNGITNNARQAAVNNAADTVYNRAMVYETDDKPGTTFQTAVDDWNNASGILPDEAAIANIVAGIGVNNEKITVKATELENDAFEIKAVYGDVNSDKPNQIQAIKTSIGTPVEGGSETGEEIPEGPYPVIASPGPNSNKEMTILDYTCSTETTSSLPFEGLSDDSIFVVSLLSNPNKWTHSTSTSLTIAANAPTQVVLYGKYDSLNGTNSFEDCNVELRYLGEGTGVKNINYVGNITWPNAGTLGEALPSTVENIDYMFYNKNQPYSGGVGNSNVGDWDTSNVKSMKGTFYGFDNSYAVLDLSKWEVSNVTDHTDFNKNATGKNIILPVWS